MTQQQQQQQKARRYVGFCTNPGCTELHRAAFVMGSRACWHCPRCMMMGRLVEERCWVEGAEGVLTTCRLHFDYEPREGRFQRIAIVDDLAQPVGATLVVESPIAKQERTALALAERLFGAALHTPVGYREPQPLPDAQVTTLSLDGDREELVRRLKGWQRGIESGLLPGISR